MEEKIAIKVPSWPWIVAAAVLSLAGLAGFIILFVRHMTVWWFILSPIILAVYQIPAALVYAFGKRRRK